MVMLLHVTLLVLASCVLQIGAKLQPFRSPTASVGSRRKGNIPIIANIPGNLIETTGSTIDSTDDDSLQWLRDEADRLSELKARVRSFLQSKNIRVGGAGASSESKKDIENAATELRAIQSTEVNNINCRIGLDPVPVGEIAVSPCDCRGTNEWIRFSLYNRLRRQDPEQWKTCRTCGADFASTAPLLSTAGPQAMAVSFLLDHPNAIRSIFVAIVVNLLAKMSVGVAVRKAILSRNFWMQVLLMDYWILISAEVVMFFCVTVPKLVSCDASALTNETLHT